MSGKGQLREFWWRGATIGMLFGALVVTLTPVAYQGYLLVAILISLFLIRELYIDRKD